MFSLMEAGGFILAFGAFHTADQASQEADKMHPHANPPLVLVTLLFVSAPVSAAIVSIEALYNAPGGGTATVTALYDDTGFTDNGIKYFNFIQAHLVFSADGNSLLKGTSHTVQDMFGIAYINGTAVELINHNNTDPVTGKSLLIFYSGLAYPGSVGIYMADSGSDMDLEGWWVTHHQGAQGHSLVSISEPVEVPSPAVGWLFGAGLGTAIGMRSRRAA